MSTLTIIGGTGYSGRHLATEAIARGHHVISFSRHEPQDRVAEVDYRYASSTEATSLVPGSDVVIATLSPRGDTAGTVLATYQALADAAVAAAARLVLIGGFGSLRPAAGQPRFAEGSIPEEYRAESQEMDAVREWFATEAPADLDWTFVSPAGGYGAAAPGTRTGEYRISGEVALVDAEGRSEISGPDFAVAVLDEIETPAHQREHIGVAY